MSIVRFLLLGLCSAFLPFGSVASADVIADAAGDYLAAAGGPTSALAVAPSGWSYLGSTAANGAPTIALTAGAVGNQGAAYQGFNGVSGFGTSAVYGTNTSGTSEFEIFANGDLNGAVVGRDLILHPGQSGNDDEFLIVRYTVSATNLIAGTGAIAGSFRELIVGGGAASESVDVSVYQNSTQLVNEQGGTVAQATPGILTQVDGTFNLTGLTLTAGDTIDFVVGINGHFGADEAVLQATIESDVAAVPEPSSLAILAASLIGFGVRRRR